MHKSSSFKLEIQKNDLGKTSGTVEVEVGNMEHQNYFAD